MLNTATKTEATDAHEEQTDGFHLVIDALKLNGLTTIYGVPGIPITDFGRMAQAEGIRVISFRHEQNAGYAAAIAGFLTKKPGVCLTVSAPGFLNGLTARWTSSRLQNRSARRRSACCMPPISALDWRGRSAPRSLAAPAASISTCRRSCSDR